MKWMDDYIKDLVHQDVRVRRHAAMQLQFFGSGAAAPLRAAALQDTDPLVRAYAVKSLGWLGDRESIPVLLELLPEGDGFVSEEVAEVLAELGDESALEPLLELARDPEYPDRKSILLALGAFPRREVAEELALILSETESIEDAVACAEALAELQYYRAVPEILRLYGSIEQDEFARENLLRCLAALIGEPRLASHVRKESIFELFKGMVKLVPADYKNEHAEALKALKNKKYRRFYKLLHQFLTAAVDMFLTERIARDRNGGGISLAEGKQDWQDTQAGAALAIINYLKENRDRDGFYLHEGSWLAVCSAYVILSKLDAENTGGEVAKDGLARLVEEMTRTSTIKPRRLIEKAAAYGDQAVDSLAFLLDEPDNLQAGLWVSECLGRIGTPKAVDMLLKIMSILSEDEDASLLYTIQDSLARHGDRYIERIIDCVHMWDEDDSSEAEEEYRDEVANDGDVAEDESALEQSNEEGDDRTFFNDPWPGIYACDILAKIRHENAFQLLLNRLTHPDDDIRLNALKQLQEYGDPAAIFQVKQLNEDDFPEVALAAKEALVWLCEANGISLPELPNLKRKIEEENLYCRDSFVDMDDEWDPFDDRDDYEDFDDFNEEDEEDDEEVDRSPYTRPAPIVKGPKIGRNDPCPCGSGKKYKKCCGKE